MTNNNQNSTHRQAKKDIRRAHLVALARLERHTGIPLESARSLLQKTAQDWHTVVNEADEHRVAMLAEVAVVELSQMAAAMISSHERIRAALRPR